jgi:hypothetical protein
MNSVRASIQRAHMVDGGIAAGGMGSDCQQKIDGMEKVFS